MLIALFHVHAIIAVLHCATSSHETRICVVRMHVFYSQCAVACCLLPATCYSHPACVYIHSIHYAYLLHAVAQYLWPLQAQGHQEGCGRDQPGIGYVPRTPICCISYRAILWTCNSCLCKAVEGSCIPFLKQMVANTSSLCASTAPSSTLLACNCCGLLSWQLSLFRFPRCVRIEACNAIR
jgi:hypothetical protein